MTGDQPQVVSASGANKQVGILIVEDEALVASYIKDVLEESGFTVAGIASSGREALSLAEQNRPTLALVDIRLAGPMDGVEVACRLNEHFAVRAIFLSGLVDRDTEERAKSAQALGFLRKPFLPSQVFNTIERVLQRSGS
jgi:DNA-binding response OmpR family regulator